MEGHSLDLTTHNPFKHLIGLFFGQKTVGHSDKSGFIQEPSAHFNFLSEGQPFLKGQFFFSLLFEPSGHKSL